jgi:iron(III) transport system substrate-binding protein
VLDQVRVSRRQVLRSLVVAGAGVVVGCGTSSVPVAPTQVAAPTGSSWDALLSAARAEGKVVVSGPPDPGAGTRIPEAFKKFSGIDLEYLAGNSSQLAARIQSERAAGVYSMDVSLSGADTVYGTFLPNGWLEPLKPVLVLPEVVDGRLYRTGEPWFRDAEKRFVMQLFNTANTSLLSLNTDLVSPEEFKDSSSLLDPRWQGKICAYDPGVNGAGIATASAIYVSKGKEFATQLFKGQQAALSRDYAQIADWVAHGSYPIGLGITRTYLAAYYQAGISLKEMNLPDIPQTLGGGFSLLSLWTHAPHPNAARVFSNWIASKEGIALYAELENAVPVRNDVDAKWVTPDQVPQPGVNYFDTYDPDYVVTTRQQARDFFAAILH